MVDGWDKMDENKDVPKNGWFNGIEWEKMEGILGNKVIP